MRSLLSVLASGLLAAANVGLLEAQAAPTTPFRNVSVFDGTKTLGIRDVLVRDGRIARIAARVDAPAGAAIIDGTGKTRGAVKGTCWFRVRIGQQLRRW